MSFLRSKKFWLTLIALIITGLLIYFVFLKKEIPGNGNIPSGGTNGEITDVNPPASQIMSPLADSWYSRDFVIEILDEDLESGIDASSCEIKAVTYDNGSEYSTGWLKRTCNHDLTISVGPGEMCGFEGRQACWIFIRSKDRSGNYHSPGVEHKSVVYFNIDWSGPSVGKVFLHSDQIYPINIEENVTYVFKTNVTDNLRITGCNLFVNNEDQGMMAVAQSCSQDCTFEKEFIPGAAGFYDVFAVCADVAFNVSRGETVSAKTNLAPEITSCRVNPSVGNTDTEFDFVVEVTNPDNDVLSFSWSFGDDEASDIQDPKHKYVNKGTYKPQVVVSDDHGASAVCDTAWVSVQ